MFTISEFIGHSVALRIPFSELTIICLPIDTYSKLYPSIPAAPQEGGQEGA